jgi:hypothetical protein
MGTRTRFTLRRLGWHRSELRRPIDRRQSAIARGLVLAFLVLGPVLAGLAAQHAHDLGVQAERRQATGRHPVDATVVRRLDSIGPISGEVVRERARVWWRAPDGSPRTGEANTSKPAGTRVQVWIDDAGTITGPPQTHGQSIGTASFVAAGVLTAVAAPLIVVHLLVRRRFNRRRDLDWDIAWAQVADRWSGRA